MSEKQRTRFASATNPYADCGYDELEMFARQRGVLLPPYHYKPFVAAAAVLASDLLGTELRDALYDFVSHAHVSQWYNIHTENVPIGLEPIWWVHFNELRNILGIEDDEPRSLALSHIMYLVAAKWSCGYREHYSADEVSFKNTSARDVAHEVLMEYTDVLSYLISMLHNHQEELSEAQERYIQEELKHTARKILKWQELWAFNLINVAQDLFS